MGILNQAKKHGHTILNLACRRALNLERINYPTIEKEVKQVEVEPTTVSFNQLDQSETITAEGQEFHGTVIEGVPFTFPL